MSRLSSAASRKASAATRSAPVEQDALSLFRAHALPAARFEGSPGAGNRPIDVGRFAIRYGGNHLAVDRRDHFECLAG
jgi:hypothetical protein